MVEIPDSHPRKKSLLSRQKIVEGSLDGLLADSAMIAHGRGEAFDYLLGEKTTESARLAIRESASRLRVAKNPVISVNGNTVLLAGKGALRLAAFLGCPIEVNLYYRTPERVSGLLSLLDEQRASVLEESEPTGFEGDWRESVRSVPLLGSSPDFRIEGLEGPRSHCTEEGIGRADSILVPLEDGDRCEALVNLGKEVIVIDLNPLSRSSRMATVTIVDEVSRAFDGMLAELLSDSNCVPSEWDNSASIDDSLNEITEFLSKK
ncbi:MAG: phosphopantothenate/pantothenate synthetase [Candidatus Thermoplasmatota archaeon]|nr:phosphopantothenate/pantothenate synthetase [Candidatus Thermoplasmatota archaeon]